MVSAPAVGGCPWLRAEWEHITFWATPAAGFLRLALQDEEDQLLTNGTSGGGGVQGAAAEETSTSGSGQEEGSDEHRGEQPHAGGVGCTALSVVVRGLDVLVANTGDSRCVLSRKGQAIALTLDHKPILFEEARRIIKVGRAGWGCCCCRLRWSPAHASRADVSARTCVDVSVCVPGRACERIAGLLSDAACAAGHQPSRPEHLLLTPTARPLVRCSYRPAILCMCDCRNAPARDVLPTVLYRPAALCATTASTGH